VSEVATGQEATMPELAMVTAPADRLLAALRRCHDELTARVSRLGEADLTRRSYRIDWSIAQVLSHLGRGAEITLAQLQAARADTTPLGPDDVRPVWARWDARSPQQQAAAFADAVPRLFDPGGRSCHARADRSSARGLHRRGRGRGRVAGHIRVAFQGVCSRGAL